MTASAVPVEDMDSSAMTPARIVKEEVARIIPWSRSRGRTKIEHTFFTIIIHVSPLKNLSFSSSSHINDVTDDVILRVRNLAHTDVIYILLFQECRFSHIILIVS